MHAVDIIYFGSLQSCDRCPNGKFIFHNSTYKCTGYFDFAKCNNSMTAPLRTITKIPDGIQRAHDIFGKLKTMQVQQRIIIRTPSISDHSPDWLGSMQQPLLFGLEFILMENAINPNQTLTTRKALTDRIEQLGGTVAP